MGADEKGLTKDSRVILSVKKRGGDNMDSSATIRGGNINRIPGTVLFFLW